MNKSILENKPLSNYDSIFKSTVKKADGETVVDMPLEELYPPEFHPFQVNDDEVMERLAKSIKQYGVREPGLVRPRRDENGELIGGYELLCGNRRKRACELAELPTLPVIVRELNNYDAALAMVDSNLEQRETLLFSERAWAYQVKLEALNHQGVKSENPGELSVDILCKQTGESKNQIFRLIRLTKLIIGLLDKVDAKQLAFNPAVELSYLSQSEQAAVVEAMENHDTKPSLSQAKRLKKMKQEGKLTIEQIHKMLGEIKKSSKGEPTGSARFRKYFPADYTTKQINDVIADLLKDWQAKQKEGGANG
jgi:ParB family chromosome partitioning protein